MWPLLATLGAADAGPGLGAQPGERWVLLLQRWDPTGPTLGG